MIERLVTKGVGTGDEFTITGAVDNKTYNLRVEAVSIAEWHAGGQKVTGINVVARNLETGIKAVWSLTSLMEKKATYMN